jgi:hypothetical protein
LELVRRIEDAEAVPLLRIGEELLPPDV